MVVNKHSPHRGKQTKVKAKTCSSCGSVECFERPRYFGGQLLTDKDLDAAQRYVIEKNRLHNRYLVGTGVVCGLAVRCHPECNGFIVIEPGYAIDCCGNDIVLCDAETFDVIDYLEQCQEEEPVCDDKIRNRQVKCDDEIKEYCLFLSYSEEYIRPVTALVRDNGCSNNRCEPSRTRESFRLDLIENKQLQKFTPPPNFWDKFAECVSRLRGVPAVSINDIERGHTEITQAFHKLKDFILDYYKHGADTRCTFVEEVCAIAEKFPKSAPNSDSREERQNYVNQISQAINSLNSLLARIFLDCYCDAALVPCVECEQEGVLLACLKIQDCKIVEICNTARQQLITGPMLRYFLPPTSINQENQAMLTPTAMVGGISTLQQRDPNTELVQWLLAIYTVFSDLLETICCGLQERGRDGRDFTSKYQRIQASINIMRDFSASPSVVMNVMNLANFLGSDTLTALDIYGRTVEEVQPFLENMSVTFDTSQAAAENVTAMSWVIPQNSHVTLTTAPDGRITYVRLTRRESP